jgi:hypothetical protein
LGVISFILQQHLSQDSAYGQDKATIETASDQKCLYALLVSSEAEAETGNERVVLP